MRKASGRVFILLALATICVANDGNLLLHKKVTLSSRYGIHYKPSMATDGITDTRAHKYAHTRREYQPWLQVDMGSRHHVGTVVIYNREDCCSRRLRNYYIHVGDNPDISKNPKCGLIKSGGGAFRCGRSGRYVGIRIYKQAGIINIAEIKAFSGFNVAVGKKVILRPRAIGRSSRRVKSRFNGNVRAGSCFMTPLGYPPRLTVDLGKARRVGTLVLLRRRDQNHLYLHNYRIRVGMNRRVRKNPLCPGTFNGDSVDPTCGKGGMKGRYVTIELRKRDRLNVCGLAIIEPYNRRNRWRRRRRRARRQYAKRKL